MKKNRPKTPLHAGGQGRSGEDLDASGRVVAYLGLVVVLAATLGLIVGACS